MNSRSGFHRWFALVAALAAAALAATLPTMRAANLFYDAGRTGSSSGVSATPSNNVWNLSTANWYNLTSDQVWTDTTGTADIATFGGTAGSVSLNNNLGALGLVFSSSGYTIGGNTLSLGSSGINVNPTSGTTDIGVSLSLVANQTWSVGQVGTTLAIDGSISGAGFGFTKTGSGTVTLTNTNTYTGTTTVNLGVLNSSLFGNTGTPFGSGSVALNAGMLSISPVGSSANISYTVASASGSTFTFGADAQLTLNKSANNSLAITLGNSSAAANSVFAAGTNGTLIISPASGVGSLGTTIGEQVFINGGAASTNGTLNGAVVLQDNDTNKTGYFATYGSPYGLGTASATNTNFSAATTSSSVEDVTAATATNTRTVGALRSSVGITINTGQTLTVGNGVNNAGVILNGGSISGGTLAFGGSRGIIYSNIANGTINSAITGTNSVSIQGPGTTTFGGANPFTGGLFINSALVAVTNDNQLGDPAGTITLNGGILRTTGTVALGTSSGNRMIVLNPGQTSTGGNFSAISGTTTFTASAGNVITGPGSLTKSGGGTLVLAGTAANTFTGETIVTAGVLNAASTGALGSTSSVTVNNRSNLTLSGTSNDRINNVAPLILSGGTFDLGGMSETTGAGTNGLGALTLTATSTLDFGTTGSTNLIQFAGLGTHTIGTQLTILEWEGTVGAPNRDRLLFAGSSSSFTAMYNQADVSFNGVTGYGITNFSGYYEIYPVPEPTTVLAGCLMVGALGWNRRRQIGVLASAMRRVA